MSKKLKRIFLLGIFLRLILLPFFAYPEDIFETHHTSYLILENVKNILNIRFSPLSHLIDSFFLLIFKPFLPAGLKESLAGNYFYIPKIHRVLFFFKLPFIFFEFAAYYLFFRFLEANKVKKDRIQKLLIFLIFNPVIIYSVYIFGRFESYNIFFTFVILVLLHKAQQSSNWSFKNDVILGLTLALAPFIREFYLLILVWIVLFSDNISLIKRLFYVTIGYLPYASWLFVTGSFNKAVEGYVKGGVGAYLLSPKFYFYGDKYISLYFFFTALLLGLLFVKEKEELGFAKAGFVSLAVYFVFSHFHPQYFTWIIPFLAFSLAFERDRKFSRLYILSWLTSFLFLSIPFPGAVTTFGVAFPLANAFRFISVDKLGFDVSFYFVLLRSFFRGLVLSLAVYFSVK